MREVVTCGDCRFMPYSCLCHHEESKKTYNPMILGLKYYSYSAEDHKHKLSWLKKNFGCRFGEKKDV